MSTRTRAARRACRSWRRGLGDYFKFYNQRRFHEALGYQTPAAVYRQWGQEGREG